MKFLWGSHDRAKIHDAHHQLADFKHCHFSNHLCVRPGRQCCRPSPAPLCNAGRCGAAWRVGLKNPQTRYRLRPEFVRAHLAVLMGTDSFTVEVLTLRGLVLTIAGPP
jgi:hypothetical protein